MTRKDVVPSVFAPDIEITVEHYTSTLGFRETGRYEHVGRLTSLELSLGEASIWFGYLLVFATDAGDSA